jgi:lipopolysaccharide export system protein LptA
MLLVLPSCSAPARWPPRRPEGRPQQAADDRGDQPGTSDLLKQVVVFNGNVVVAQGTMAIRAGRVEVRSGRRPPQRHGARQRGKPTSLRKTRRRR